MRNFGGRGGIASTSRRKNKSICAHADYRREDFIFPRTQSLVMQDSDWEIRAKPIRHWGFNFIANLAEILA